MGFGGRELVIAGYGFTNDNCPAASPCSLVLSSLRHALGDSVVNRFEPPSCAPPRFFASSPIAASGRPGRPKTRLGNKYGTNGVVSNAQISTSTPRPSEPRRTCWPNGREGEELQGKFTSPLPAGHRERENLRQHAGWQSDLRGHRRCEIHRLVLLGRQRRAHGAAERGCEVKGTARQITIPIVRFRCMRNRSQTLVLTAEASQSTEANLCKNKTLSQLAKRP